MAGRGRKPGFKPTEWRFYVYEIVDGDALLYVGKGSGRRLRQQIARFKAEGREIARFKRERDAYAFERERIAECSPPLNKAAGGNGSRAEPMRAPRQPLTEWEREGVSSRVYAARFLLRRAAHLLDPSTVERIRQVAYG